MPALGGPSSTTFHSSGEKASFDVIRSSFPIDANQELLAPGEQTHDRDHPRAGARRHQPRTTDVLRSPRPAGLGAERSRLDLDLNERALMPHGARSAGPARRA